MSTIENINENTEISSKNEELDIENLFKSLLNENDKEKLKLSLEELDFENHLNSFGQNILHLACKEGNKEIVFQLIQIFDLKNKDFKILTSKEDQKKWTPIYYAIDVSESGFPDIVDLLLKNGSDSNKQDDKGITALHLAAYKGQDDNVEILLKHKANPNIKDISGRIALNYAIMEGQTNSVQALLEKNSDLCNFDLNGDSLFHYAIMCKGNALLYVIMLAERGIDVNLQNSEGDTALNLCAKNGAKDNIRIIQKLLEFKADPSICNYQGQSFYEILSQESERNTEFTDKFSEDEEGGENENNKNKQLELYQSKEKNKVISENPAGTSKSLLKINIQLFIYVLLPILILISSKFFEEFKLK